MIILVGFEKQLHYFKFTWCGKYMSDIKLFHVKDSNNVAQLVTQYAKLEKDFQQFVEENMDTFLGVRFLASEFTAIGCI